MPQVFKNKRYTDDDVFYECKSLFGSDKLKVRSHAAHLNDIQVDRNEVHNDPASTILSCKRITAVHSQILLKALLWERTAVTKTNCLPFTYLCEKDYTSEKKASIRGLNYYLFAYLIPGDLMFSDKYWKWRLTNPSETEIYERHLDFLLNTLDIDGELLFSLQGKERFRYLLECRNCDAQLIDSLLNNELLENVNWDVASSKFEVEMESGSKSYWRIDVENADGSLSTNLTVKVIKATKISFCPLVDVAGFVRLKSIVINGEKRCLDNACTDFVFIPKTNGAFDFLVSDPFSGLLKIECVWEYKKVFEFLNNN